MFTIHLAKELFKFSCSHFTILSANQAERLHGHNYQVRVDIGVNDLDLHLGFAFDFNAVKPMIQNFCAALDERILLPARSPFLQVSTHAEQMEVVFAQKRYSFPSCDTVCLPLSNITTEELARHAWHSLARDMAALPRWTKLQVQIEETRGQSASFFQAR